jgi:uncharacterized protein (TIGR00369 family)
MTATRTDACTPAKFEGGGAMTLTGLECMQGPVNGDFSAKPPMADTPGMSKPVAPAHGHAWFGAAAEAFLLNPLGMVHGGVAAAMLDSAMGCPVHTALPEATGCTTAELTINYTRAILPGMGLLRAEGSFIHVGRRMATAEGRPAGAEDGKLYAHGATTCFVFALGGGA